jgi:hypothetical protein
VKYDRCNHKQLKPTSALVAFSFIKPGLSSLSRRSNGKTDYSTDINFHHFQTGVVERTGMSSNDTEANATGGSRLDESIVEHLLLLHLVPSAKIRPFRKRRLVLKPLRAPLRLVESMAVPFLQPIDKIDKTTPRKGRLGKSR